MVQCNRSIACGGLAWKVTSSNTTKKNNRLVSRHVFQRQLGTFSVVCGSFGVHFCCGSYSLQIVLWFTFVMQCLPLFLAEKSFKIWTEKLVSMFWLIELPIFMPTWIGLIVCCEMDFHLTCFSWSFIALLHLIINKETNYGGKIIAKKAITSHTADFDTYG